MDVIHTRAQRGLYMCFFFAYLPVFQENQVFHLDTSVNSRSEVIGQIVIML